MIGDSCLAQVTPVSGPTIPARITNISGGGAHVVVPTYLPRGIQVYLEIPPAVELPPGRIQSRIMKIRMIDREPRYGLGLRFEDTDCEVVRTLRAQEQQEASA